MKEIISDEFIRYKSGFISGKNEVIELFKLGKLINLNKKMKIEHYHGMIMALKMVLNIFLRYLKIIILSWMILI